MNTSSRYDKKKEHNSSSEELSFKDFCFLEVDDIKHSPPKKDKILEQKRKKKKTEGVTEERQENISPHKDRDKPSSSNYEKEKEKNQKEILLVNMSLNNKKTNEKKSTDEIEKHPLDKKKVYVTHLGSSSEIEKMTTTENFFLKKKK